MLTTMRKDLRQQVSSGENMCDGELDHLRYCSINLIQFAKVRIEVRRDR